jgi:ADP-heptose:LPS heptosyltransferase
MPVDLDIREAAARRWTRWMLLGDFESAWRESDLIDSTGYKDPHKVWNGESWAGKRVMLRCLHGLGDAMQFIRYAPMLKQTCQYLTVQCHPELVTLMRHVDGVDRAVTWGEDEDAWQQQLEVTELARAFRTSAYNIPSSVPYISLSDQHLRWAGERLGRRRAFRVGLVWKSSTWNPKRSIPPSYLMPLLLNRRCEFYILQKGAESALPAHDIQKYANDVADTAALMAQLDLIITVDTMAAHLAGALGVPVWILLPARADWRWMLDRDDSPWYPTATLFRQKKEGDWKGVITQVVESLCAVSYSANASTAP